MFLGIEIGGTKLQLGLGRGDGHLAGLWRGSVEPAAGAEGIRRRVVAAVPELLARAGAKRDDLRAAGVGFGGPTDDATQTVIKSHQVAGWDGFPLAAWLSEHLVGLPAVLCNDADTAGLGEALYGAGRGLSPIFYITVGTGIGGGLIVDGKIYRGVGKGAAEIGHLPVPSRGGTVEGNASGPAIERAAERVSTPHFLRLRGEGRVTAHVVAREARNGDAEALGLVLSAVEALAEGIAEVITLLCPRRVVVGGGVSLMGEALFFAPLRRAVAERTFTPFAGLTDIVPAALGEEVVIHGALALARDKFGG